MRVLTILSLGFATAVLADNAHFGHSHHKRQNPPPPPSTQHVIVRGAAGAKPLLPRLDVAEMMKDNDMWNIFLLAMYRFQRADIHDPQSYWGMCGIHGEPYKPYNNVQRCPKCPMDGYCHHHTVTFSLWHRPYIALWDQGLRKHALDAANEFKGKDRAKYIAAAQRLLTPRWDWALPLQPGEPAFPAFFTDADAAVITPDGPIKIQNPLKFFNYTLAGIDHSWAYNPKAGTTTRDHTAITPQWRRNIRANLWAALSSPQTFNEFGCEALQDSTHLNPHSLESCHDQPHGGIGGDMNDLSNSACDPSFMLHHTNVDFMIELWMRIHPDSWMVPHAATGQSFTHTAGTILGPATPLLPFLKDANGHFWTSNDVRNPSVFGYQYPGLGSQQEAQATMNKYYRDGGNGGKKKRGLLDPFFQPFIPVVQNLTSEVEQAITAVLEPYSSVSNGKTIQEYTVVIKADTMAEKGSFFVFLFDGTPGPDPAQWDQQQDILLGWFNFFTTKEPMTGVRSVGGISITDALLDRVLTQRLKDMQETTVKQYLTDNMQIKVMRAATKQEINVQDMPGFELTIQHNPITMPTCEDGMPKWDLAKSLKQVITPGGKGDDCEE